MFGSISKAWRPRRAFHQTLRFETNIKLGLFASLLKSRADVQTIGPTRINEISKLKRLIFSWDLQYLSASMLSTRANVDHMKSHLCSSHSLDPCVLARRDLANMHCKLAITYTGTINESVSLAGFCLMSAKHARPSATRNSITQSWSLGHEF